MKIKGKTYKPIGYGLGYCLGGSSFRKKVFYFKGYPQIPYEECEIVELKDADPKSFESDTIMGEGRDKKNKYFQGKIVEKGKGEILNQDWEFIPLRGLKCQSIELFFNKDRAFIQDLLGNEEKFNFSINEFEDSYEDFQNTETCIRLVYNESNKLKEIEFSQGSLRIKDISIIGHKKDVIQLKDELEEMNFHLIRIENEYWMDEKNKFTFSSSEDMGGDSTECVYFYTADDFTHLINE